MSTVIYREVQGQIHILNYVSGQKMHLARDKGLQVLLNQGRLQTLHLTLEEMGYAEQIFEDYDVLDGKTSADAVEQENEGLEKAIQLTGELLKAELLKVDLAESTLDKAEKLVPEIIQNALSHVEGSKVKPIAEEIIEVAATSSEEDLEQKIINLIHDWLEGETPARGIRAPNSINCRKSLIEMGEKFNFPAIVQIELNRSCVLDCNHCVLFESDIHSPSDEIFEQISLKRIEEILDDLANAGVFLLVFSGGEPFSYSKFEEILEMAADKGFLIEIESCLQDIPSWFTTKLPLQRMVGAVRTKVYSIDAEIHDGITGRPGSLEKTKNAIKELKGLGYAVEVVTPLLAQTFSSRKETAQYFIKLGVQHLFDWPVSNELFIDSQGHVPVDISQDQFVEFIMENPGYLGRGKICSNKNGCAPGMAIFAISADGDVLPCIRYPYPIGNIRETLPSIIFKSDEVPPSVTFASGSVPPNTFGYNFCPGFNYTETGDPAKEPPVLQKYFKTLHNRLKYSSLN